MHWSKPRLNLVPLRPLKAPPGVTREHNLELLLRAHQMLMELVSLGTAQYACGGSVEVASNWKTDLFKQAALRVPGRRGSREWKENMDWVKQRDLGPWQSSASLTTTPSCHTTRQMGLPAPSLSRTPMPSAFHPSFSASLTSSNTSWHPNAVLVTTYPSWLYPLQGVSPA